MYESLAVRFLEAKWRNVDIIVGFTLEEEISCRASGKGRGTGHMPPFLN